MNADNEYSRLLTLPAAALAISRAILESQFDDPAHALHPFRALHRAAMTELSQEPLAGKHVLHYSSGTTEFGIWMATESAEVHLLDSSPANLELGLKRAEASGVARRVKAIHLTDPANLDMFAADAFDLVFARTPLAEFAATPGALDEIARIMKPEARLVLAQIEPPARAARTALDHLFAEVGIRKISARQSLLARVLPGDTFVLITARK